jgi:hypothetical protein
MRELYNEDVASHVGPESCVGDPVRAQRSVDRGRAGGAIEPRNTIHFRVPTSSPRRKARLLAALWPSRWWALRGQRSQARTTSSMHENREISWSPAGGGDAPSWKVRGVAYRRWAGREGNAEAVIP